MAFTAARTVEISDSDLSNALWLAARAGVVHASPSQIFVGLGSLLSIELGALESYSLNAFNNLRTKDLNDGPALRCFIAAPFHPDTPMQCLVPSIQIAAEGSARTLTCFGRDDVSLNHEIDALLRRLRETPPPVHGDTAVVSLLQEPTGPGYAEMVDQALSEMERQGIEKVVLARSLRLKCDRALDPAAVLERMRDREPSCTLYAFSLPSGERVVGASPELLIAKHGHDVASHPLAGTLALEGDRDPSSLTDSVKDLEEHRVVVDEIAQSLTPLLDSISVPNKPSLVALSSVAHLGTEISGATKQSDDGPNSLDLLAAIHPTPAIAGVPVGPAIALLDRIEPFDRGFFGGAFGWLDEVGDGEFMLGIRGVWLNDDQVWLAAGAGIVAGSTPEGERLETLAKLRSILDAAVPNTSQLIED